MRSLIVLAGLFFVMAANAADKPVVVAEMAVKQAASAVRLAAPTKVMVTQETSIPEGSLEKFGAVGLPQ